MQKYFQGLTPENMPALHALAVSRPKDADWERAWGMVRRLFGVRPAIVPVDVDAARLHPQSEATVAAIYKTNMEGIAEQMSVLELAWAQLLHSKDEPQVAFVEPAKTLSDAVQAGPAAQTISSDLPPEFTEEQLKLISLGTFSTGIFDYPCIAHDKKGEIEWFCERIKEVRKVFEEPMARSLARQALLNELQLRRIADRLATLDPASKEYHALQGSKEDMERTYQAQWAQVEEMCPYALSSGNRKASVNNLADLIELYLQFKRNPENMPRDGVFTDDEIQVLFRQSQQDPEVKYRFGWVLSVLEAKRGIGDPNWKRQMSERMCKMFDTAFAWACLKASESLNIHKPDLELDGPEGEYPPIYMEHDGEITDPDFKLLAEDNLPEPPIENAPEAEPAQPAITQ